VPIKACRVQRDDDGIQCSIIDMGEDELNDGTVLINIAYSGINYKDALGATGRGKIYRQFPINAGIDCSGIVESSNDLKFNKGDVVLVNGCGLGESQDGGFANKVKVPASWVMSMPAGLDCRTSMIYGTAGFTAALAIERMERNGQKPDQGPIVVTGASGGVGSFAISFLSKLGYDTIAVTGRAQHHNYLMTLGATQVLSSDELDLGSRPLEKAKFAGAIDNVGGELLSGILRHVDLWGNVASIGMAAGQEYSSTVFPYILRGVSILGVSSTNCPMVWRESIWKRIGRELIASNVENIVEEETPLSEIIPYFQNILNRKHRGRILVNCA